MKKSSTWSPIVGHDTLTVRNVVDAFYFDRQSRQYSINTIRYYKIELELFLSVLNKVNIEGIEEITPVIIRSYLFELEEKRNPGGRLASFRAIKTFLRWVWDEWDLETRNPISKLRTPKVTNNPQQGVELENVKRMIAACTGSQALRDKALLLTLLDTGVRASELIAIRLNDIDIIKGEITIEHGKGGKSRQVFIGRRTRKELNRYIKQRKGLINSAPLFVTDEGTPLSYWGLRQIIRRCAKRANVPEPGAHDFRRAFCLALLRQGIDLVSISRLMGHKDITLDTTICITEQRRFAISASKGEPGGPISILNISFGVCLILKLSRI